MRVRIIKPAAAALRVSLFAAMLALTATVAPPTASNNSPIAPGNNDQAAPDPIARAPQMGKLRKLHLVRPDLIPYPIMFEVYC
jgi:hypothetical protein